MTKQEIMDVLDEAGVKYEEVKDDIVLKNGDAIEMLANNRKLIRTKDFLMYFESVLMGKYEGYLDFYKNGFLGTYIHRLT